MSKFKVGNPWKTGKTNAERKGIWATGHEQPKGQRCSRMKNIISFIINRLEKPRLKIQETPVLLGFDIGFFLDIIKNSISIGDIHGV
jgi:hypothetical protein